MATWKKVIVSGSNAHLNNVTGSSFQISSTQILGAASTTGTIITGSFSGSFAGSIVGSATSATSASVVAITETATGTGPYYITFVDATTGHPAQRIDSAGITYDATNNALTLAGDIAINGGDITSTAGTFNIATSATSVVVGATTNGVVTVGDLAVNGATSADITTTTATATVFNTNATTVNAFGAATTFTLANNGANAAITIGSATSTASFGGRVVIGGDLDVNGSITTIDTTNLLVADRFILLASGSSSPGEGGIVIQQSATGPGELFGWDNDNLRWSVTSSYTATGTTFTPDAFVSLVSVAAATTPAPPARYSANGNIYVSTDDQSIWIYS